MGVKHCKIVCHATAGGVGGSRCLGLCSGKIETPTVARQALPIEAPLRIAPYPISNKHSCPARSGSCFAIPCKRRIRVGCPFCVTQAKLDTLFRPSLPGLRVLWRRWLGRLRRSPLNLNRSRCALRRCRGPARIIAQRARPSCGAVGAGRRCAVSVRGSFGRSACPFSEGGHAKVDRVDRHRNSGRNIGHGRQAGHTTDPACHGTRLHRCASPLVPT